MIHCKNCSRQYNGNFCYHCGQPATTKPIDWHYIVHDVPHSVLHIDKGFFYTFVQLLRNPGKAIKEYLHGKRVQHFKPIAYVIIMSTICTILYPQLEKLAFDIYVAGKPNLKVEMRTLFWEKYISLFIFLMIPFLSVITYITFRNKVYNFWEHVVGNIYLGAQLNILLLIIKLYGVLKVSLGYSITVNYTLFMFGFMAYYSYTFRVWMAPHKSFWHLFVKLLIMNFFIASVYMTGLSITSIMSPWWDF